jgi:hypothetical protein
MSPTRPATAPAALEALLLPAAGIDRGRAAVDLDAAFVDGVIARRQGHPAALACARIRLVGPAAAALTARLKLRCPPGC